MGCLPGMLDKIVKDRNKIYRNLIIKGDERTLEEVISNNIMEYMNKNNLSYEEKLEYLDKYRLYLHEENDKNKGTNIICYGLATIGLTTFIYAFATYNDNIAYAAFFITSFIIAANAIINKNRPNIYEAPFETQYQNNFFESLIEEDNILRKAIKHNKQAKTLLK
jgi:hypothetical protein